MAKGYIEIGKRTKGHDEKLRKLGFEVAEVNGNYVIETNGFVTQEATEAIDATTQDKLLAEIRKVKNAKKLFTYQTRFLFTLQNGESKVLFGPFALSHLGEFSCLVAKQAPKAAKKVGLSLNALDEV